MNAHLLDIRILVSSLFSEDHLFLLVLLSFFEPTAIFDLEL